MILGLMSVKEHDAAVSKLTCEIARLKNQIALYQEGEKCAKENIRRWERISDNQALNIQSLEDQIEHVMKPFVDKLVHLRIENREWQDRPDYQCCVTFCMEMIETCFQHGNSDAQIEFLAHSISNQLRRQIETLIRSRNFYREK
jgi:hypothetical protein